MGNFIGVVDANFGRADNAHCCSQQDRDNGLCDQCGVISMLNQTWANCNGKQNCTTRFDGSDLPSTCQNKKLMANVTFVCLESNPCSDIEQCLNTNGSYVCLCPDGYSRNGSESCEDIDECHPLSPKHNCESLDLCRNTIGSFFCEKCQNLTCENCGLNAICEFDPVAQNTSCLCPEGYAGDPFDECRDVDECANATLNTCHLADPIEECINVNGSYSCVCTTGFDREDELESCIDIDECAERGLNNCRVNQTCVNTFGSYHCSGQGNIVKQRNLLTF